MRIIRIHFSKTGEAAYISHLDLQRVMARALRRSGMPVWWSQGFNPHIYMSFALPLSLGQQSLCETVDCKTESEEALDAYVAPLNGALPRGIEASAIAPPVHGAEAIAAAEYCISYPGRAEALAQCVAAYNALESAVVTHKTKRSESRLDLKEHLPALAVGEDGGLVVRLPAGSRLNLNPALLAGFLEAEYGLPAAAADILRVKVYTENGDEFR